MSLTTTHDTEDFSISVRHLQSGKVLYKNRSLYRLKPLTPTASYKEYFAYVDDENKIILRDVTTFEILLSIEDHGFSKIMSIYMASDLLFSCNEEKELLITDLKTGYVLRKFYDYGGGLKLNSLSGSDDFVAYVGEDNKVIVRDCNYWRITKDDFESIKRGLHKTPKDFTYLSDYLIKKKFQDNCNALLYHQQSPSGLTFFHNLITKRHDGVFNTEDIETLINYFIEVKKVTSCFFLQDSQGINPIDNAIEWNLRREVELLVNYFNITSNLQYRTVEQYYHTTLQKIAKGYSHLLPDLLEKSIKETRILSRKRIPFFSKDKYLAADFINDYDYCKDIHFTNSENLFYHLFNRTKMKKKIEKYSMQKMRMIFKGRTTESEPTRLKNIFDEEEVASFVYGFPNFLGDDGLFRTIVENDKKNLKAFETKVMKAGIFFKWNTYARWIHSFETLLFTSGWLVFVYGTLLALSDLPLSGTNLLAVSRAFRYSMIVSMIFLIIESVQFFNDQVDYLKSAWNYLQVLSYFGMLLSSFFLLVVSHDNLGILPSWITMTFISIFVGWTNIFLSFNILSFLRPFAWSGPLIRMILQIIEDMIPFLVLQIIILFGFTIGFMTMLAESDFFQGVKAFLNGFTMLLGDFDMEEFHNQESQRQTDSALVAFSTYMLFGPIITMNLLIAIMGDSYDFVRENQAIYGLKEKVKAINEIDRTFSFFFTKRQKEMFFPKYLHVLTKANADENSETGWEGHLKKLKSEINSARNETKTKISTLGNDMIKKHQNLEAKISQIGTEMNNLDAKLDRILDVLVSSVSSSSSSSQEKG